MYSFRVSTGNEIMLTATVWSGVHIFFWKAAVQDWRGFVARMQWINGNHGSSYTENVRVEFFGR